MTSSSSSNPSFVMEGSEVEEKVTKERIAKFTALMTLRTAESLAEWLLKNVAEAKKAQAESEIAGESGKVH